MESGGRDVAVIAGVRATFGPRGINRPSRCSPLGSDEWRPLAISMSERLATLARSSRPRDEVDLSAQSSRSPGLTQGDIASTIMNSKSLGKVRRALNEMRKSPQGRSYAELRAKAKDVGRSLSPRGKEPTWIRDVHPELSPPLSIPNHSGDVPIGTARSIIDQLLDDCDDWEQYLMQTEENGDE